MGDPGLDPGKALQIVQTLLYCLACILGGAVLVALSAYIAFLCTEVFSPQPSKARRAKVRPAVGPAPATEERLDLFPAETPISVVPERLGEEAMQVPTVPPDAQTRKTLIPLTLRSESTGP